MATRVLSPFRPPARAGAPWAAWVSELALWGALAGLAVVLWVAPTAWGVAHRRHIHDQFNDAVAREPVQLLAALERPPTPGPGFPEDAGAARSVLAAQPILAGALRWQDGPIWVAGEGVFRAETGTDRWRLWRRWAEEARSHRSEGRYDPTLAEADPPVFLLLAEDWLWVVRWEPGSSGVEALLRLALGAHPAVRVGLAPVGQASRTLPADQVPAVFRAPNLQATLDCPEAPWAVVWTGTMMGPNWQFIFHPWPDQAAAWEREVARRTRAARILGLGILSLLGIGLLGRRRQAQRRRLEADRLASLAHSLKTPLAIHKLRCDTLRMGHLDEARQREELLRLGQEVDDLTRLIERGLLAQATKGASPAPLDDLGEAWFENVAEGLRPALEALHRNLDLDLAPAAARAHGPALGPALVTLLENAVYHGAGAVRLRTWPEAGRLQVEVRDQGPGLDGASLQALGRAFQRLRRPGEEGFRQEGQGLGLFLLTEVAQQEGWGLSLDSAPGQGFAAKMELPLATP